MNTRTRRVRLLVITLGISIAIGSLGACGADDVDYVSLCRDAVHSEWNDAPVGDPEVQHNSDNTMTVSMESEDGASIQCEITEDGDVLHARVNTD